MGLPNVTDNYKGYEEGDLSNYADRLRDKQFLLVSFNCNCLFLETISQINSLFSNRFMELQMIMVRNIY